MALYLNEFFNNGIFIGEIVSSMFLVFFIFIIKNTSNIKQNSLKLLLVSVSVGISIIIGKTISNLIEPGATYSFGLLPILLINAVFFESYNLVLVLMAAEIIGSIIGFILYKAIKNNKIKEEEKERTSYKKFILKEVVLSFLFVSIIFISFYSFNSGLISSGQEELIKTLIISIGIFILLIIFDSKGKIMLSPLISILEIVDQKNIKKIEEWKDLGISLSIQIGILFSIGFSINAIKGY